MSEMTDLQRMSDEDVLYDAFPSDLRDMCRYGANRIKQLECELFEAREMLSVVAYDQALVGRALQGRARTWVERHDALKREAQK